MTRDLFAPPHGQVARVALPLPVDRLFDYAVPRERASTMHPAPSTAAQPGRVGAPPAPGAARRCEDLVGRRVRVRAGGRLLVGVVVEVLAAEEPHGEGARTGLREIEALLDAEPAIGPSLLEAIRQEARDALCPLGVALAAALPPGSAPRAERALALGPRGVEALRRGVARGATAQVLQALADGPVAEAELRRRLARRPAAAQAGLLARLERERLVVRHAVERGPRVRAEARRVARLAEGLDPTGLCAGPLARAPAQAALVRALAAGPQPVAKLAPSRAAATALRALRRRGLVVEERQALAAAPPSLPDAQACPELTSAQHLACRAIGEAVRARRAETFLLHGITGSGKTEVYLRAVAEALALGRQALVLVPEITLTHQILGRLRARFGDRLAVLHSGLRPGERLAAWERLRRGDTPIAVGARSALFAPMAELGVIVLDEEHEPAYKSGEGFRYHARSLAARRARADACPLLLGSATPSLETRFAAERGAIRRLELPHRIGGRPLPAVELVDLASARAALPRGRKLVLAGPLLRAMQRALDDGAQTILFLNRRGFSTQIACMDCQHVVHCKHCDIALTYHAGEEALRCHYCDYRTPPPASCPHCGSEAAALLGVGTQRLEEEVRAHLPSARIARLDRDTAARRGRTEEILQALRAGELDVLVGTQMVAKGHDFPGVRLVGVVNADLGLHFPDFRAAERTFQLLTQVAGRAGRGESPGQVVVQTWSAEHYAIAPVRRHDYETFYRSELAYRRELGYPPFGALARVLVSGPEEDATWEGAARLAEVARAASAASGREPSCEVLGPAPAPLARLRGRYRVQVLLKHAEAAVVHAVAASWVEPARSLGEPVRAALDTQPVDML